MPTVAEAAQMMVDFVEAVAVRDQLFYEWASGAADGGPGSDGSYPLTDFTGFTRLVPCPAKVREIASAERSFRNLEDFGGGYDKTPAQNDAAFAAAVASGEAIELRARTYQVSEPVDFRMHGICVRGGGKDPFYGRGTKIVQMDKTIPIMLIGGTGCSIGGMSLTYDESPTTSDTQAVGVGLYNFERSTFYEVSIVDTFRGMAIAQEGAMGTGWNNEFQNVMSGIDIYSFRNYGVFCSNYLSFSSDSLWANLRVQGDGGRQGNAPATNCEGGIYFAGYNNLHLLKPNIEHLRPAYIMAGFAQCTGIVDNLHIEGIKTGYDTQDLILISNGGVTSDPSLWSDLTFNRLNIVYCRFDWPVTFINQNNGHASLTINGLKESGNEYHYYETDPETDGDFTLITLFKSFDDTNRVSLDNITVGDRWVIPSRTGLAKYNDIEFKNGIVEKGLVSDTVRVVGMPAPFRHAVLYHDPTAAVGFRDVANYPMPWIAGDRNKRATISKGRPVSDVCYISGTSEFAPGYWLQESADFKPVNVWDRGRMLSDAAAWTPGYTTVVTGQFDAEGADKAFAVMETADSGEHYLFRTASKAAAVQRWCLEIDAKSGLGRDWLSVLLLNGVGSAGAASFFNVTTGAFPTNYFGYGGFVVGEGDAEMEAIGGGWYRCRLYFVTDTGTILNCYMKTSADGATTSYAGDITKGLYMNNVRIFEA